jgi:hypothetical protein
LDDSGNVDLYEFLVTRDYGAHSVQKSKTFTGITLAKNIFINVAVLEKDLIFTNNSQLINLKTKQITLLPCIALCAIFIEDKDILAVGLANGQLLLINSVHDNKSNLKIITLSTEPRWTSRPILSLVNCPSQNRLLIYNENMVISLDTFTNSSRIVQDILEKNIMHVSVHTNDTKLRILSRPWDQVMEDLPPVFAGPKYGFN